MFNSIFMILLFYPSMAFSITTFASLPLPPPAMGPDSFAFDSSSEGPYTGVADGRILKFAPDTGFQDYAFTSPNRSKEVCDGYTDPGLARTCGRPLGIGFYYKTGQLFVADAILGLMVVPSSNGGPATQLADGADGVPFRLADAIDVDQVNGTVYFTDASAIYNISQIMVAVALNDATGRLLKYEQDTKRVTVLLNGLSGPAGVAISPSSDFLLFTEFISGKVKKYWITGPKANTCETLITFFPVTGRPDNIKRDPSGNYWIAVNFQPIVPLISQLNFPTAVKINADGRILAKINLSREFNATLISEVQEHEGALYVGSMNTTFIAKYNL